MFVFLCPEVINYNLLETWSNPVNSLVRLWWAECVIIVVKISYPTVFLTPHIDIITPCHNNRGNN